MSPHQKKLQNNGLVLLPVIVLLHLNYLLSSVSKIGDWMEIDFVSKKLLKTSTVCPPCYNSFDIFS